MNCDDDHNHLTLMIMTLMMTLMLMILMMVMMMVMMMMTVMEKLKLRNRLWQSCAPGSSSEHEHQQSFSVLTCFTFSVLTF